MERTTFSENGGGGKEWTCLIQKGLAGINEGIVWMVLMPEVRKKLDEGKNLKKIKVREKVRQGSLGNIWLLLMEIVQNDGNWPGVTQKNCGDRELRQVILPGGRLGGANVKFGSESGWGANFAGAGRVQIIISGARVQKQ